MPTEQSHTNRVLAGIIVLAVLVSLLSLLIPTPPKLGQLDFHLTIAEAPLYICFNGAASVILLLSIKAFKPRLRLAYTLLALGTLTATLAIVATFVLKFTNTINAPGVFPFLTLAFVCATLMSLNGMRLFAKLLQIQTKWRSLWLALGTALAATLLSTQLPHVASTGLPEIDLRVSIVLEIFIGVLVLFTLVLIYKIKTSASPVFMPALAWLLLSFCVSAINVPFELFLQFVVPGGALIVSKTWVAGGLVMISGLFLIKSAVAFSRISSSEEVELGPGKYTFFGRLIQPADYERRSAIDVVIYMAGLASSPAAVNTIMDGVRGITIRLAPGQALSEAQQAALANIYTQLETYLVDQEPVRKFDHRQIHDLVSRNFRQRPEASLNPVFWQQIDHLKPTA